MYMRDHSVLACSTSCFVFYDVAGFFALIAISHCEGDKVRFGREVLVSAPLDDLLCV